VRRKRAAHLAARAINTRTPAPTASGGSSADGGHHALRLVIGAEGMFRRFQVQSFQENIF
jgi:hypothetical protein